MATYTGPKALETEVAPSFSSISNWNQWMNSKGITGEYVPQVSDYAKQYGLSQEDAAFRLFYGLDPGNKNVGQTGPMDQFGDLTDTTSLNMALQNKAIQPAVQSLQASIPETQALYKQQGDYLKSQEDPLKSRYDAIIQGLSGQQQSSINTLNTNTSREFGKRGVPVSSGAFDQYLFSQSEPVNQYYASQIAQTGASRNTDLLALANQIAANPLQEQEAIRNITNAIASLQAGAGKDAITNAMTQYNNAQNIQQQNKQLDQNMQIAKLEASTKGQVFQGNDGTWYTYNPSGNSVVRIGA